MIIFFNVMSICNYTYCCLNYSNLVFLKNLSLACNLTNIDKNSNFSHLNEKKIF